MSPTSKIKFVDELPGVSKSSKYDEFFTELETMQKTQPYKKRRWAVFKENSETRVSMPINWRDKFEMSTRTIWENDKPFFNVYVKLKDSDV